MQFEKYTSYHFTHRQHPQCNLNNYNFTRRQHPQCNLKPACVIHFHNGTSHVCNVKCKTVIRCISKHMRFANANNKTNVALKLHTRCSLTPLGILSPLGILTPLGMCHIRQCFVCDVAKKNKFFLALQQQHHFCDVAKTNPVFFCDVATQNLFFFVTLQTKTFFADFIIKK